MKKKTGTFLLRTTKDFDKKLETIALTLSYKRQVNTTKTDVLHELVDEAYEKHVHMGDV